MYIIRIISIIESFGSYNNSTKHDNFIFYALGTYMDLYYVGTKNKISRDRAKFSYYSQHNN